MSRPSFPVAVNLVLKDSNDRLLFHRRANTGYCDGQLAFLGGHVELSESSIAACARELNEEGGLTLERARFSFDCLMHKLDIDGENRFDLFFCVDIEDSEKSLISIGEPQKCSEMLWLSRDESIKYPVVPYVAHYLKAAGSNNDGLLLYGY